jgi:hypothetical protein
LRVVVKSNCDEAGKARQVVALHARDLVCGQPLERAVNHTNHEC